MRVNLVRTSHLHASRAWVSTWGLVLALLWAQSLGLLHGIVHGGHGVGSVHASLAIADAGEAKLHGFFLNPCLATTMTVTPPAWAVVMSLV